MSQDWIDTIDSSWTLFLDRDGVINFEKEGDYIRNISEWKFIDGVLDAIRVFHKIFRHVIIVTNQKGIGRGLMTEDDLENIHKFMLGEIRSHGGDLTKIYYCTSIDNSDPRRKPNTGMAIQASEELPGINFSRSLMIGNTMSDMKFGKACGMYTIFIPSSKPMVELPDPLIDKVFPGLFAVAKALQKPEDGR